MLSGPLTSSGSVRGRISFSADQHDGYLLNLSNNQRLDDSKARSVRGQLAFDLSESATLLLSGDYSRDTGTGPVFQPGSIAGTAAAFGGRLDPSPRRLYADGPFDQAIRAWGLGAKLVVDAGAVKITSITGYRDNKFDLQSDLDGTDFFLVNENIGESAKQFSQEIQLASNGDGPFQWLVGGYYFRENGTLDYKFPIPLFATTISFDAVQKTRAFAAFGQASYALSDKLKFTAGLRWSRDKKSGSTIQDLFGIRSVSLRDSWAALTPRFVFEYQANSRTLLYASAARGFKGGGINTGSVQVNAYNPEYIWNYEIGLKSRFLDNRLQTNVAAFYYTYSDLQVIQFAVGQTFIQNAASAHGKGIEAEITALPADNLSINLSFAYLDASFTKYSSLDSFRPALGVLDLKGNQLPRSAKFTSNVSAQYSVPLSNDSKVTLRGEYSHRSKMYFTSFNTSFAQGGDFDLFNARIAYVAKDGRWEAAIFGKNLTDNTYEQAITVSGINAGTIVLYAPPRTYGMELRFRF